MKNLKQFAIDNEFERLKNTQLTITKWFFNGAVEF